MGSFFQSLPKLTPASFQYKVGQFRGQILIVGNSMEKGGTMQLYAACYTCIVAENVFGSFGFTNWGRNPHGAGWQPNIKNIIADNTFTAGAGVLGECILCFCGHTHPSTDFFTPLVIIGCSRTCSSMSGQNCSSLKQGQEFCPEGFFLGRE